MSFRFIHTADVHLDSPLKTLALKDPELAKMVASATRQAFSNTIDLCIEEGVDALLIAGDLYDGELKSMKTAAFFSGEMRRLTQAGIRAFVIKGNHDAESKITKHLVLPEGVHVFSGRGEAVAIEGADVLVHGMSFAKPCVPASLLPKYQPPVDGAVNIGLLHTSLAGSSEHDVYSPCSVQQLKDQGYDYWALGHIHKREVHAEAPHAIVMPGIPQGRHINEAGPKSTTYVEIADDRGMRIEERHIGVAQFERVAVELTGIEDWRDMLSGLEQALAAAADSARADHLIARLELKGLTPLSARLRRDRDVLIEEGREAARRCGSVFIEDVHVNADSPSARSTASPGNPVSELRRLIDNKGFDQSGVAAEAMLLLVGLRKDLPPELRDMFGDDDTQTRARVGDFLNDGAAEVLARLETAQDDT